MSPLFLVAALTMGDLPPPNEPVITDEQPVITDEQKIEVLACDRAQGICVVEAGVLRDYVKRYIETERKYKELAASKGCAKLEVVPKKIPGMKKERDS